MQCPFFFFSSPLSFRLYQLQQLLNLIFDFSFDWSWLLPSWSFSSLCGRVDRTKLEKLTQLRMSSPSFPTERFQEAGTLRSPECFHASNWSELRGSWLLRLCQWCRCRSLLLSSSRQRHVSIHSTNPAEKRFLRPSQAFLQQTVRLSWLKTAERDGGNNHAHSEADCGRSSTFVCLLGLFVCVCVLWGFLLLFFFFFFGGGYFPPRVVVNGSRPAVAPVE